MNREIELSKLQALQLHKRREMQARELAAKRACPVWIVRTRKGERVSTIAPVMGEHWHVAPSGQITHNSAPVI